MVKVIGPAGTAALTTTVPAWTVVEVVGGVDDHRAGLDGRGGGRHRGLVLRAAGTAEGDQDHSGADDEDGDAEDQHLGGPTHTHERSGGDGRAWPQGWHCLVAGRAERPLPSLSAGFAACLIA